MIGTIRLTVLGATLLAVAAATAAASAAQSPLTGGVQASPVQTAFAEARRLFDDLEYERAIAAFDDVVTAVLESESVDEDLLVQALELRARAHFALGNTDGTRQDFEALLRVRPSFMLAVDVSPRVVAVLDAVRAETVGQLQVRLLPAGTVEIDGTPHEVPTGGVVIDLAAGNHQVSVTRTNYAPIVQSVTVTAGEMRDLDLVMVRVSASLEVQTVQEGVEVLIDGVPRGQTATQAGGVASLTIDELSLGPHELRLMRDCYVEVQRAVTLRAEDLRTEPIELQRAIATVRIEAPGRGGTVFVDGESRGQAPAAFEVCEGPHVIEVRGPAGRFVDRRDWRTGDDAVLEARLRSAFAMVSVRTTSGTPAMQDQLRDDVARVLAASGEVLIFTPEETEWREALQAENVPDGWLSGAITDAPDALPGDVIRQIGRRLAARLNVQGFAAVVAGSERFEIRVGLLAAGSGRPEVLQFNTSDPASQQAALSRLDAPLPEVVRPSIDSVLVDVAGVQGAVVVRAGGAGAAAGLAAGDTIVGAGGRAVASVANLRAVLDGVTAGGLDLDVLGADGQARRVAVSPSTAVALLPLRDPAVLYNRALLELQDLAQTGLSPAERSAAHVNLAVVQLRLGSWEEALQSLGQAGIAGSADIAAGTLAYLRGLALEGAGRTAEAQAAFTEAANARTDRLGRDGPLVAPLARSKLSGGT